MKTPLLRLLCLVSFSLGAARAADPALQPIMTEAGAPLMTDSFASAVPKAWKAGKGTWTVANGVLQGTERKAAALRRPGAKSNVGLTVSGGPAEFRDISIAPAKPRGDWAETKSRLAAK